jgi:hypothetical protein
VSGYDDPVMLRLISDRRAMQLMDDSFVARASIAAHSHSRWPFGRRWFVILVAKIEAV